MYSVDKALWDSAFESNLTAHLVENFVGPNQGLWEDLDSLEIGAADAAKIEHCAFDIVAVTEVIARPRGRAKHPSALRQLDSLVHCSLLGYDVADYFLHSFFGISVSEPSRKVKLDELALNEWGLFANFQDALNIAKSFGRAVPEHSPFFAYGLYVVGAVS